MGMKTLGGSTTGARLRLGGTTGEGFDSALAERVRLYLQVTTLINLLFTAVLAIVYFSGGDQTHITPKLSNLLTALAVASFNGLAWFLISKSRRSTSGAMLTASITTFMLSASYTYIAVNNSNDPNPTRSVLFILTVIAVVLVLRSSLIPSPTSVTALIGGLSMALPVYISRPSAVGEGWVFCTWILVLAIVFVAVTAVTSHTVYGMQRKMRAAAQLGQYQIERPLGRGGMGEVYLANHALLRRPTAIKLLRDVSATAKRDLFRQEVQTAAGLTHPNTVEIYDYGRTPEGVFYFAMEYVEGATLEDVVRATGAMPAGRVLHMLLQAAGSLGEAHGRGLVHRDIKPSNLMLCERGGIYDTLKVMDFGLVRDLASSDHNAEVGLTGTPLYLAPETILSSDGAVPQSDVYALGATAYFLLTGAPPFVADSLVEILSDHLAVKPSAPPCDDPTLAALVLRCLAKDPLDRPEDASALAEALRACRDHEPWSPRDAEIWWAEHQEVVAAQQNTEASLGGTPRSS